MTLVETYLPFGIRDVKITPFIGELGVGTPIDLPVGRVVTFREVEDVEILKSDDRNVVIEGTGAMVEWELEAGGISFEAWQIFTGASLVTGAGFRELVKLDTDVRPYFVIEGQSINDDGSDLHVIIRRCKVNGAVEGTFEEGAFFVTKCEGLGIGDSTGELWRMRWNTGPVEVFGGVRALPNIIRLTARPLTISVGNVVAGTLTPATMKMEANKLQVGIGTEIIIAMQPKAMKISAVAFTISGGVGATVLAPKSMAMTAVALTVSRGLNLMPAIMATSSRPLSISGTSTTVQAESGTVEGGAQFITDNAGYTGTSYVGFFGQTGDVNQITFNAATGGTYPFSIRYGQGEPANAPSQVTIRVNGAIQGNISLPNTSTDWSNPARFVQSAVLNIPLNAGNNIIRIEHSGLEYKYADLDSYTIGTAAGGGGSGGVAPVAEFSMNPTTATVGQSVQFNDQSTNFPTSWAWNFGDAATSTAQNPSHSYAGAATYNAQLTATNASGSNSRTHSIVVTAGGGGGGTPDYVVGVNGTLQQLLELPASQLSNRRILVPTGLWNGDFHGVYIVNKDFGGLIVEFQSGAILRGPGGSGWEMFGEIKNLTIVGPGTIEGNPNFIDGNGLFMDSGFPEKGSNGNPNGNITIDGLTFQPHNNVGQLGRSGCSIWGGENYTIRNVTVRNAADNAAYGYGGAGSLMSYGRSRTTGFALPSHGYRILIENCNLQNGRMEDGQISADRNGIIFDLYHGGICFPRCDWGDRSHGPLMVRNNFVKNVGGSGIHGLCAGRADSQVTVRDNRVEGPYGVEMDGPVGYAIGSYGFDSENWFVFNNDVVTTGGVGSPYFFSATANISGTSNTATGSGNNSPAFVDGSVQPAGFIS